MATGVKVQGSTWIVGKIPDSPGGKCAVDVEVAFGASQLKLPAAFCYAL